MFSTTPLSYLSVALSTLIGAFLVGYLCPVARAGQTLTVAGAADLSGVEEELGRAFGKQNEGWTVTWVTGASGVLEQQIEHGAPYDVFLSANAGFVDQLQAGGKVDSGSVAVYATGRLGILSKDGAIRDPKHLAEGGVRYVAVPNPKLAPYGVAAIEVLKHEGVWEQVRPKLIYGENVRQVLQLFESGNADCVMTAASLLQGKGAYMVPEGWHSPIRQKAAVVASSVNREMAKKFVMFLTGAEGRAIFAKAGFGAP